MSNDKEYMITDRRKKRIEKILFNRQPDIIIVSEWVHKESNISALMRTADAFGFLNFYIVRNTFAHNTEVSKGSEKWLNITKFKDTKSMTMDLKKKNIQIIATGFTDDAMAPEEIDFTLPTAIIWGNELDGVSDYAFEQADKIVKIPMVGMVQSLNVSVSAGIIMYEIFKQRKSKGMYDKRQLSDEMYEELLDKWTQPNY